MNSYMILLLALSAMGAAMLGIFQRWRRSREVPADGAPGLIPAPGEDSVAVDQYLYDRCCRYMTERRPFLVETFTLQDLANAVFTNKLYLSRTINRFSGKNFKNYVNYYRIMYAMELFRRNMCLHIAELAGLSGFRSETVFLRNFKSVMGEPPSQWCSRIRKKFSKNR